MKLIGSNLSELLFLFITYVCKWHGRVDHSSWDYSDYQEEVRNHLDSDNYHVMMFLEKPIRLKEKRFFLLFHITFNFISDSIVIIPFPLQIPNGFVIILEFIAQMPCRSTISVKCAPVGVSGKCTRPMVVSSHRR